MVHGHFGIRQLQLKPRQRPSQAKPSQSITMGFVSDRFNLEKQMTFYLSYHDNKVNQAIHLLCIWPIFVSGIMILAHTEAFAETPAAVSALPFGQYAVLNWSVVMAAIYMAWYIALDAMCVSANVGLRYCETPGSP